MKRRINISLVLVMLSILLFSMASCQDKSSGHLSPIHKLNRDSSYIIIKFDHISEGRPVYSVFLSDETVFDAMYPEEIAQSLIKGEWHYNEDLKLTDK